MTSARRRSVARARPRARLLSVGAMGLFALLAGVLVAAPPARAHELQPVYLELRETAPDTYAVLWKVPARDDLRGQINPVFPAGARAGERARQQTAEADLERFTLVLPGGLAGRTLRLDGPAAPVADALVRVVRADGAAQIYRLNPATPELVFAGEQGGLARAAAFFRQGVEHILMGVDHLLFVLGLLLIVRRGWMLVKTITAFTVAHSLTLAAATLGWASAPGPPLQAAIALSILFVGDEAMRARRGETSLAIRAPWAVAFAFGLLHGFGFASGLTALGLPRAEIPSALLFFNLGVEAGQLLFVGVALLLARAFRVLEIQWTRWAQVAPHYTVGVLGAFWTIERTWFMFGR